MKIYIECFYKDDSQILGNMDGQAIMTCKTYKSYKQCNAYKRIKQIVKNPNFMNARVHKAHIVAQSGTILEIIE